MTPSKITREWTIWTNIPEAKPIDVHNNKVHKRVPLRRGFESEDAAFAWLIQNANLLNPDRIYEISCTIKPAN